MVAVRKLDCVASTDAGASFRPTYLSMPPNSVRTELYISAARNMTSFMIGIPVSHEMLHVLPGLMMAYEKGEFLVNEVKGEIGY